MEGKPRYQAVNQPYTRTACLQCGEIVTVGAKELIEDLHVCKK